MSENAEDRFKRTMDRLFSSPASSSANDKQSIKLGVKKTLLTRETIEAKATLPPKLTVYPPVQREGSSKQPIVSKKPQLVCRPWNRVDLFRRLATFKSLTWFGKPEAAGPVNCARRGWVNRDVDLIACEGCNAMLSFPCPPTWSQQQAESAAESFSNKLDSGHKDLCPWKGNACVETLAQFPPTPVAALVESFRSRCDELHKLRALPAISSSTIDFMKTSKGSKIDRLLSQAPANVINESWFISTGNECRAEDQANARACTYYQALTLIGLCGWELRLLPYIVDLHNESAEKDPHMIASNKVKSRRHSDPGPSILMCNTPDNGLVCDQEQKSDVGRAVFDCSLCGASVGLWLFSTISRPSMLARGQATGVTNSESARSACGLSAASGIEQDYKEKSRDKGEVHDESCDAVTSVLEKIVPTAGCLDLKLTIAGGPPPTKLSPKFAYEFPNVLAHSKASQLLGNQHESMDQVVIDKQQPELRSSIDEKGGGRVVQKRKRTEGAMLAEPLQNNPKPLVHHSSVDAMDTCFENRPENSAESVEMPQEHCRDAAIGKLEENKTQVDGPFPMKRVRIMGRDGSVSGHVSHQRAATEVPEGHPKNGLPSSKASKDNEESIICTGPEAEGRRSQPIQSEVEESDVTALWERETKFFDPILQHRHFCPWVNINLPVPSGKDNLKGVCGWQLTLDALEVAPADIEPESASSMYIVDPLTSVHKIFGKPQASQRPKGSSSKG